jgi:hypothetical protein
LATIKVKIVVATRMSEDVFYDKSALGQSLKTLRPLLPFELCLFSENTSGLPNIYNSVIDAAKDDPSILVFLHDDVFICDFLWLRGVLQGLQRFDLLGLVGNKRRLPRQSSWAFVDDKFTWDKKENFSGIIGHGSGIPNYRISAFGEPGQAVKLLDGVFLACQSRTLHKHNIKFDELFDFHFYDLDICRQVEAKKLKMGTWPISVIHESGGAFGSSAWRDSYAQYLDKWGS